MNDTTVAVKVMTMTAESWLTGHLEDNPVAEPKAEDS